MTLPTERRLTRRRRASDGDGIVTARIKPGHDATIVDVSAGGALVETNHRLLPGSPIELQLSAGEQHVAVRGRVLRSSVARVRPASVGYRGAVGFDRQLPWFTEDDVAGSAVPGADVRVRRAGRVLTSPVISG